MNNMRKLAASERLGKVEFSNYEDWDTHPRTAYECPFCKEIVTFNYHDFDKHAFSKFTNLPAEAAERIEKYVEKIDEEDTNSYLDFMCQGCGRPVRLYYTWWGGGRHGEAGFIIRFFIENEV